MEWITAVPCIVYIIVNISFHIKTEKEETFFSCVCVCVWEVRGGGSGGAYLKNANMLI